MTNKSKIMWKVISLIFVAALLAAGGYAIYNAYSLGLGNKICGILGVVVLVLVVLLIWKYKAITPKLLSTIFIIIFFFIGSSLSSFVQTMNDMARTDDEGCISLIVMKNSTYHQASDLSHKKIGFVNIGNLDEQNKAKEKFASKAKKPQYIQFNNVKELVDNLYSSNVDAIILNESLRSSAQEAQKNFTKETRVIDKYKYTIINSVSNSKKDVTRETFNVFVSGMDTYGNLSTVSRSDVNLIVSVNPIIKQVVLIGLPRDLYVNQPCQNNQKDKLTHSGMFGVDASVKTVEQFLNINIDYYAKVNFSTIVDLVNSVGGIYVNSPNDFVTEVGGFHITTGMNHLNGAQALGFVRERHSFASGDKQRNQNQMIVIESLLNKMTTAEGIKNYKEILPTISNGIQTDMSSKEMSQLINLQLSNGRGWHVVKYQVDGTGITAYSPANGFNSYVMVPNESTVVRATNMIKDNEQNKRI